MIYSLAVLAETGAASKGLDAATKAIIQSGFDSMTATVTEVVGIAVVAAVAIITLTVGVNFALKKIRGVMNKAS